MGKPLWLPLYPADYLRDTAHLSTLEHGAYLLLLMATWTAGGKLPDDPKRLARIARLDADEWAESGDVLMAFFHRQNGKLVHRRVTAELGKADRLIEQKKAAGKASAKARAEKAKLNGCSTDVEREGQRRANQSQSQGSNAYALGAEAPSDLSGSIFDEGVRLLVEKGSSEQSARGLIGKLRKDVGDPRTLQLVRQCRDERRTDPRAWLSKMAKSPPANDASALIASVGKIYGGAT